MKKPKPKTKAKAGRGQPATPLAPKLEPKALKASGIEVHCAHSTVLAIEKVTPNPRNPNTHPLEQLSLLGKIIAANGWRSPITVSTRSGFVVKGHGRLLAAQGMGLTEVPVDYQHYGSEALEWSDLIADNKLKDYSEFNGAELSKLIQEMNDVGFDLSLTALRLDEIGPLLGADWTPPVPDATEFDQHVDQTGSAPIAVTPDQRAVFVRACAKARKEIGEDGGPDATEGRLLELICGDYLAG
jgi:hypothetical protein